MQFLAGAIGAPNKKQGFLFCCFVLFFTKEGKENSYQLVTCCFCHAGVESSFEVCPDCMVKLTVQY